jgi:hypothetical protein
MRLSFLITFALVGGCTDNGNATNPDLAAAMLTCADYCSTIHTACGFDTDPSPGPNDQFASLESCLGACKTYPVGMVSDTSGNTLGCRTNHAMLALKDPKTHCPHAGPAGAGTCGSDCEGFCQLAMTYCTAMYNATVYTNIAQCMSVCQATPDDVPYTTNTQDGAHVACLIYHAEEAASVPKEDPTDHCANAMGTGDLTQVDAGRGSVTCM